MSGAARNQPCPCGSGRKYKHCCLRNESTPPPAPPAVGNAARIHLLFEALNAADPVISRHFDLADELLYDIGLDARAVPHEPWIADILALALKLGLGIGHYEPSLYDTVLAALPPKLQPGWREVRFARPGAWQLVRARSGGLAVTRFGLGSGGEASPLEVIDGALTGEPGMVAVGWYLPELRVLLGRPLDALVRARVAIDAILGSDEEEAGARALAAYIDPRSQWRASKGDDWWNAPFQARMVAEPYYARALRSQAEQLFWRFDAPLELPEGRVHGVLDAVALATPEGRSQAVGAALDHVYRRALLLFCREAEVSSDLVEAFHGILPPEELLKPLGLRADGGLEGYDEAALLRRPAALLLLPADHPWLVDHRPEQPIRLAARWAADRGDETVPRAIADYLREMRWLCAARSAQGLRQELRYTVNIRGLSLAMAAAALETPLSELNLSRGARNRLAAALRELFGSDLPQPRIADLPPAPEDLLRARGFGLGTLADLAGALFEHAETWRARRAGRDPRALDPPAPASGATLREGLEELGALFD